MISEQHSSENTIRLLFLGSYKTDRRLKSFARFFQKHGFSVEVIFAEPGHNTAGSWNDGGCKITQIPIHKNSGPLMFFEYRRKIWQYVSSLPKSFVTFACELYSLDCARKSKLAGHTSRVIYDARELYTELPSVTNKPLSRSFWKRNERRGLLATDLVVVTAPLDAPAICEVHGFLPRTTLIRNLPEPQTTYIQSNYLREKYPIIAGRKILIYGGGVQADRGLEEMLEVMKELQKEYAFVIIGDGSAKQSLITTVKMLGLSDSVFFHEATHSDELYSILTSADIGISLINTTSASYELALPSKIFEYMQAGLPILASKIKQAETLFPNEKWIRYTDISTKSIIQDVKALSPIILDVELRSAISKYANVDFTFDVDARSLLELLSD
jgi:glycosyltransferase involved in cell wall biosynthesis